MQTVDGKKNYTVLNCFIEKDTDMLPISVSCCGFRRPCETCRLCFITNFIIDLFEVAFRIGLRSRRIVAYS